MTLFDPSEVHDVSTAPAALSGPLVRVRMTVAYDGTRFHGVAIQAPGVRTVVGELKRCLEKMLRHPVDLAVAGRTDRGVHAWGQVVTFDASAEAIERAEGHGQVAGLAAITRGLNRMLGPEVVVRSAEVAEVSDFHARFSAEARSYRYTVLNREVPDPFLARTAWHIAAPLDLAAMRMACDPLIGEHDFASFCRKPTDDSGTVRRILDARWLDLGEGLLRFDITATSFCQQMVRSIVGTVVDVGLGKMRAGELVGVLAARERGCAGPVAPAHGLCLWQVTYPGTHQEG